MKLERLMMAFGIGAALFAASSSIAGQDRRGAGNSPDAAAWQPARLADGQPDIQGIWAAVNPGSTSLTNPVSQAQDIERRRTGVDVHVPSRIVDPPDGLFPYQPWAAARQKLQEAALDHPTRPEDIDTQHRCLISGVPRLYTIAPPVKIMQTRGSIVFIFDEYHAYRVIPLDDRPHVAPDVKLWMGDARGHWAGNTLQIDTTNVRGARLTYIGDFYTENAHITERFTPVDADTLRYEATVDDPTVFTRPWTMRVVEKRRPDEEMWETACYEGNVPSDRWLLKSASEPR